MITLDSWDILWMGDGIELSCGAVQTRSGAVEERRFLSCRRECLNGAGVDDRLLQEEMFE